ncbi:glycine cleavage system protein T [Halobacteriales archaeon QS_4_69_34]|nr:MAG: glycine cleavage system protein T [Halobacteriales archaeon QS_4_69_34]
MALRESPLRAAHAASGATFTEFGGWEMPVEFESIHTEHASVRESVGKFDVSHMGEIEVSGPDAAALLDRLTTNDVTALDPGTAQYAMITDSRGTILDDTVVYRLPEWHDTGYLFVPNAGHDGETTTRWESHREEWALDATVENRTDDYAMIAVQGPDAAALLAGAVGDPGAGDVRELPRFGTTGETIADAACLVSRTGYTGEDGFEVVAPAREAGPVWDALDCQPCGLGARDTLRIEMGFLLSGQDFDPEENPRTPYEADVAFAVDLGTEFVGRDALARAKDTGVAERLVGFALDERGVPRAGYDIVDPDDADGTIADGAAPGSTTAESTTVGGEVIGTVTSGTVSPTLGEPIGLGYVPIEYAKPGTEIAVAIRGEPKEARVRATPFVDG